MQITRRDLLPQLGECARVAQQQAVEDKHSEDADFAAKQIAMFDRMIERFERLMENREPGYRRG